MDKTNPQRPGGLEQQIIDVGNVLIDAITAVLAELPGAPHRPQELARLLGLDSVITSRMLKSLREESPIATIHRAPGPDPMRRLLTAAGKKGASSSSVKSAQKAVDAFDELIRVEAGNRSALNAMIAGFLPGARAEFELRRKQGAFKSLSELRGASLEVSLTAFILAPSKCGTKIDLFMIVGLLGLRRWRPDVTVKFDTRRFVAGSSNQGPTDLHGNQVEGLADLRLDEFCTAPPSQLETRLIGEFGHYLIGGSDFGPRSAADFIFAEAYFGALPRYADPKLGRKTGTFMQTPVPGKVLQHDVFVHSSLFADTQPELHVYDTSQAGVADINDRRRDIDRWEMTEEIQELGSGIHSFRSQVIPRYLDLLRHTFEAVQLNPSDFRGYRTSIDYPVYCSQTSVSFDTPQSPQ